ncbi:MAG: CAP domain-containing protein [Saprospiraceae bacterium]
MNYKFNFFSRFQKTTNHKERNQKTFLFSLVFTLIFFLTFSNQKLIAQNFSNCVGSSSTQKYTGSMRPSDQLLEGQNLTSANGKFHLRVTAQGELVIEEILETQTCEICNERIVMRAGRQIWKAPSGGGLKNPPRISVFDINTDCNICFVSKLNQQWCATNGNDGNQNLIGQCDKLILTNDGRLVLINEYRQEIWSNKSSRSSITNNSLNNNRTNLSTNQTLSNDNKFHISNTDLRNNGQKSQHDLVDMIDKGSSNQDKSNLGKGTYVCLNLSDGSLGKAMVVGEGLFYGPNQDSYAIKIVEGSRKGQKYYLKPYQIDRVGDCTEASLPSSSSDNSTNIDLNLLEQKIMNEINIIRTNPWAYADELANLQYAEFRKSNNNFSAIAIGNDLIMRCDDDNQNCQNANLQKLQTTINYLRLLPRSLPLLKPNGKLGQASSLLAADRGEIKGRIDSQGRSPACRAESVGYPSAMVGECLDSGYTTAAGFVFSLLISPLHRNIILNADANEIGVDVVQHNNERANYIRSVIMTGNNNYADSLGSCR